MDETFVRIADRSMYLFRAVDSHGETVDFYLPETRDCEAAKTFPKEGNVHRAVQVDRASGVCDVFVMMGLFRLSETKSSKLSPTADSGSTDKEQRIGVRVVGSAEFFPCLGGYNQRHRRGAAHRLKERYSVQHIDQNSTRTASCITRGSRAAVYCPNCAFTWLPLAANRAVVSNELN